MMKSWKIAMVISLFTATSCGTSSNKVEDETAQEKTAPGICAPLELTPIELPCLQVASAQESQQVTLLRSADGLDEIYGKYKTQAPECEAPTLPAIDWDKYDVIGVSIMSRSCVMEVMPAVCLREPNIEANVAVNVANGCEADLYKDQFYLVPKLPSEAQVTTKFTLSEADQTP